MNQKKIITILLFLIVTWNCNVIADSFFSTENNGLGGLKILPADVAFAFSSQIEATSPTNRLLLLHWKMPEGYYLYRDKFKFVLKEHGQLSDIQLPPPTTIIKDDFKSGQSEVYKGTLEIKLPLQELPIGDASTLEITYQGCAENRLCYPAITKTVDLPPLLPTPDKLGSKTHKFLKADEAFRLKSAKFTESSDLILTWQIAKGYYLYKNKFIFSLKDGGELATPQFPPSLLKKDPVFGNVQIYQQPLLEIIVPIKNKELNSVTLSVSYQGCAFAGLCYPPTTKVLKLNKVNTELNANSNLSEQDRLAKLLASANVFYTILIFFGLGFLLSLTPCIFPMIPILSSIIVGQGKEVTTYKAFWISLTYVVAMALTYAIVGALTALLGENLSAAFQTPSVLVSFSLIFVLLSFSMFGFYKLELPSSLQTKLATISHRQQGGTLIGVAIMGMLSALIVGPCVAAPLLGALIYISQTGDALLGGLALFSMGMGMGVPLIIVGMSAGHWLPKAGNWMESVKNVFGVMLLAVAIWMLQRIIPIQATMLLWASLLIISAVYLGVLDNLPVGISGWHKFWKGLGVIFFIYGILLIIGAASGNLNPLQPLYKPLPKTQPVQTTQNQSSESQQFKPIKGIKGLERELAAAKAANKPVMLDFSAEWCVSCKEMDSFTFADAGVQTLLKNFIVLRADVTANDEQDKALNKRFQIFGPPMVLFFDRKGKEQPDKRIVGFMPAEEFRQHLKQVLQ